MTMASSSASPNCSAATSRSPAAPLSSTVTPGGTSPARTIGSMTWSRTMATAVSSGSDSGGETCSVMARRRSRRWIMAGPRSVTASATALSGTISPPPATSGASSSSSGSVMSPRPGVTARSTTSTS